MNPIIAEAPIALRPNLAHLAQGTIPHASIPAAHPVAHAPTVNPGEMAGKTVVVANDARQATSEQKTAAHLRLGKAIITAPVQVNLLGMLAGGIAGKLGFHKARAVLRVTLKSAEGGLRETTIGNIGQLKANTVKFAAGELREVANDAADAAVKRYAKKNKLISRLPWKTKNVDEVLAGIDRANVPKDARLESWATGAEKRAGELAEEAAQKQKDFANSAKVESLRTKTEAYSFEDTFKSSPIGKRVHKMLDKFMDNRKMAAELGHTNAGKAAREALTAERHVVVKTLGKARNAVGQLFKRGPGEATEGMHHLHTIVGKLDSLDTEHLAGVKSELKSLMEKKAFQGEAKHRAEQVAKHVGKALGNAESFERYGKAAGGNLKTVIKIFGESVGKVSLLNALLAGGFVLGAGAVVTLAKSEKNEDKAALKRVTEVLGSKPEGAFAQALKNSRASSTKGRALKTGTQVAGEAVDAIMWMPHNGGGMAMMGAFMLPQAIEKLIEREPMLGALHVLDMSDKGQIILNPAQRVEAITHAIAGMPTVAAQGGFYNRLAKNMAAEMVEQGFKYPDVINILGHNTAFTKFAAEVSAKKEAEAAKLAAEVKSAEPVAAAAPSTRNAAITTTVSETPKHAGQNNGGSLAKAEAAYDKIEKPGRIITANDNGLTANDNENAKLQGRINDAERLRA